MGAIISVVMRALAWSGIGYVANDVYDYVMTSKASGSPVTGGGVATKASDAAKSFFTASNIIKYLILSVLFAVAVIFILPKVLPKMFKKPKK
jgi:hypothetical protein